MSKLKEQGLDGYFAAGGSWAEDQQEWLRSSRRIAWRVAIGASSIAVLEAIAIIFLTPLKRVEPLTLLVDRQTGYVQALKPLDPQLVSSEAALTQSFLVQYVIAREGFDYSSLQTNYRKVALWSQGSARSTYLANMQASNPESPIARYPRSTVIDVQVKSVTPLSAHTALVRFDVRRVNAGGNIGAAQPSVSVIRFAYSGEPMSIADRYINPLGFQVISYRRSMEALPNTAPVAQAAQPSQAPMPYGPQRTANGPVYGDALSSEPPGNQP